MEPMVRRKTPPLRYTERRQLAALRHSYRDCASFVTFAGGDVAFRVPASGREQPTGRPVWDNLKHVDSASTLRYPGENGAELLRLNVTQPLFQTRPG